MSVFVHAQGIKTVHAGGQKIAKFCPRNFSNLQSSGFIRENNSEKQISELVVGSGDQLTNTLIFVFVFSWLKIPRTHAIKIKMYLVFDRLLPW